MTGRPASRPSAMLRGPGSATILAITRRRRITTLEQELAAARQQLAEAEAALAAANATIDDLIRSGLAVDNAADRLVDTFARQVETLQADVADRDFTLDRVGDEVASVLRENHAKDDHIDALEMALLRPAVARRQ